MRDISFFFSALVLWFVLSRWVLPWLGIPTCMSGNCRLDRSPPSETEVK
jgi:hypothetical protein